MANRRTFLQTAFGAGAGLFAANRATAESIPTLNATTQVAAKGGYQGESSGSLSKVDERRGLAATAPVVTTDVGDLPFEMDGDTKVFRLTAHVLKQQIAPNKTIDVWGFNGSAQVPPFKSRKATKSASSSRTNSLSRVLFIGTDLKILSGTMGCPVSARNP